MKKVIPLLFLVVACGGKSHPANDPKKVDNETADTGDTYGEGWDEYGGDEYGDAYGYGGDEYGGGYDYTPPPPQPPNLTGTWASACAAGPTKGQYTTATFVNTKTDWDLTIAMFSDSACTKRTSAWHNAGTYAFGAQSTTATGAWEATFTVTKREVTADDKKSAKAVGKLCGIKKMKAGAATDILAAGCAKMGIKPLADCGSDNDIVTIDGLDLRFGVHPDNTDSCTADKRPTAIDTTVGFTYQGLQSSGIASCDTMQIGYAQLLACDKLPDATKDAIRQAMDAMKQGLSTASTMDPAAKQSYEDACKAASDGLLQTISAMGC